MHLATDNVNFTNANGSKKFKNFRVFHDAKNHKK